MKRIQHSFAFYIYLLIGIVSAGVLVLFIVNSGYALSALREQTYITTHKTLSMYSDYIEDSFNNAQSFLSSFAYKDEDLPKINSDDQLTRYIALTREHTRIQETLPSHSMIDGFFLYNPQYNLYTAVTQTRVSEEEAIRLHQQIPAALTQGSLTLDTSGNWIPFKIGQSYYMIRLIYYQGTYVGALVNVSNLLESLRESSLEEDGIVYFNHETFGPMSSEVERDVLPDPVQASKEYTMVGMNGRYLAVACSSLGGSYYLIALIPDASIRDGMGGMYDIIILAGVLLVLLLVALSVAMRQLFIKPMGRLSEAIRKIRDGQLETTVHEQALVSEFQDVNRSFNEMSSEIRSLKISVYEQKLKRQQIYQEYLKQQITPHFYINCLNTIYSMAGLGKTDLVRRLAKELSVHLRYTMNSQLLVSLNKELDHIRNYLSMTELRYPNTLQCELEVDPETETALVPPLMIQTFVENTIKHETVPGEPMEIHLTAEQYWQGSERRVHICIWDTGRGYPEEVLERLTDEADSPAEDYQEGDGTHIGLSNTIRRLRLVFGEGTEIHFSNRAGAGAQCDILFPFIDHAEHITEQQQL